MENCMQSNNEAQGQQCDAYQRGGGNPTWIGKILSDTLPMKIGLKQGDALSPLNVSCALELL